MIVVLALSLFVVLAGSAEGLPVALAGAGVAVVLGWRLALLASELRERVWGVLISEKGEFPLVSVEWERSRLLEPTCAPSSGARTSRWEPSRMPRGEFHAAPT